MSPNPSEDNMSSSQSERRRPQDHPNAEPNPFIAFRHFADAQASSLLNTVLTLPATLARYHDTAYQARMECLFRRADAQTCEQLAELENKIEKHQQQARERIRSGDLHAVWASSDELLKLQEEAEPLRRQIVGDGEDTRTVVPAGFFGDAQERKDVVEKVANHKGQEWGWSWDWGFPRPFDAVEDEKNQEGKGCGQRWRERMAERRMDRAMDRWNRHIERQERRMEEEWNKFAGGLDATRRQMIEGQDQTQGQRQEQAQAHNREADTKVWSWSFQWPPVEGRSHADAAYQAYLDEQYAPQALEHDEDLRKAGVQWRAALEDLLREEQSEGFSSTPYTATRHQRLSDRVLQRRGATEYPKRVPWDGEETAEEPSYEYSHDHEDQHDEPPSPTKNKDSTDNTPPTELDAYERFLGPPADNSHTPHPSVLSTLTTTERTVAPDGSVTTKVVLKTRFADGREESSETVHTKLGQDDDKDPWKTPQVQGVRSDQGYGREGGKNEKKSGWFWSS